MKGCVVSRGEVRRRVMKSCVVMCRCVMRVARWLRCQALGLLIGYTNRVG